MNTESSLKSSTPSKAFIVHGTQERPVIDIHNVNHYYGDRESNRKQVLFNNSLKIYAGEIVILTGPSGSGKTTLLTLIGGLRSVQQGSIKIAGRELFAASPHELQNTRKEIGFIFQKHNLFESLSAQQTLTLATQLHRHSTHERSGDPRAILEELGLADRLHHKPHQLSGGQCQRVAIGRALINNPSLILADEPTAALDKESTSLVTRLFQKRAQENRCTIVIVTHDARIFDMADRIVNLVDGTITSNFVVADSLAIIEFLRMCPVFKNSSAAFLAEAAHTMKTECFSAGDTIIREGDAGDAFYLIKAGRVEVHKGMGTEKRVISTLTTGDFFGELALLTNAPRQASVVAADTVECFTLDRDTFIHLVDVSSDFKEQLKKTYFV